MKLIEIKKPRNAKCITICIQKYALKCSFQITICQTFNPKKKAMGGLRAYNLGMIRRNDNLSGHHVMYVEIQSELNWDLCEWW